MNLTDIKDDLIIALTSDLLKPQPPRSRKPAGVWEAGSRFIVKQRYAFNRKSQEDDQPVWKIQQIPQNGSYFDTIGPSFHQLSDAEMFVRIIMNSEPIRDLHTVLVTNRVSARETLERLLAMGLVTLETIEEGAAEQRRLDLIEIDAEQARMDAAQAERDAAKAATATGTKVGG